MSLAAKQELLQRAVELVGRDELAERIGVSPKLLDAWINGDASMPDGKLLVVAAILKDAADSKKK